MTLPEFIEHRSTETISAPDRMDQWRAWHPLVELNPRTRNAATTLRASLARYRMPDGSLFGSTLCGEIESRFGKKGAGDYLLFSAPTSGAALAETGNGEMTLRADGSIYVVDGRQSLRVKSSAEFLHNYLVLPRNAVCASGKRDPFAGRGISLLPGGAHGLLALAGDQLRALQRHLGHLDECGLVTALRGISSLLVLGAQQLIARDPDFDLPAAYELLYTSACRVIESYCSDAHVTASSIAITVGCSRAQLYRAFAMYDTTVADVLRDARMRRAKLLLTSPRPRPLAQIAAVCGYSDPSSFSRAFRAAVGQTPHAWRMAEIGARPRR